MAHIHVGTKDLELDEEGFLCNPEEWDEDVARVLARNEGIDELDEERLDIIKFLRDYHEKYSNFPILKYVCKKTHASSPDCMTELFTNPMVAWKIAGLPKPPNVFFNSFDGEHYFANPFY